MQRELERIMELQPSYSPRRSPAMDERGALVRDAAAQWLRGHATLLGSDLGLPAEDVLTEGRDGTGLKTRVPWLRFSSRTRSPHATDGFYVVYLFDAPGTAVYLSLNQGTTDFNGVDFVRKPVAVLSGRVEWARENLSDWRSARDDLVALDLGDRPGGLGEGYELGNIASLAYRRGEVPDDTALLADAREFATALGALYRAHARAPVPYESPEVDAVRDVASTAAGKPRPGSAAGFRQNAAERKAVEEHAVDRARTYYRNQGWAVAVLGKPYDLRLTKDDETLFVEVKGTTSDGFGLALTDGEVRFHEGAYPQNALVIVRHITLERGERPRASGGTLYEVRPWKIDPADLRVVSYAYQVPGEAYAAEAELASETVTG